MATFLTDLMRKGYTQDEIFAVIFESERERKRRRMQTIVIEIVSAYRLKKIKKKLRKPRASNLEKDEWF